MTELPDFLRGVALIGKYGANYLPVAVDASGQLYIVLVGAPAITIPGNVNVNDLNTLKQVQGFDGANFQTAKVDSEGRFVMVPIGASGYYLNVDAAGNLTSVIKGFNGANYIPIAADAAGNMVAVIKDPTSGQIIAVDANGFITAVLKGDFAGALKTISLDVSGRMIGVIADVGGNFGQVDTIGLAELASRLGGLQRWDTRGKLLAGESFDSGIISKIDLDITGSATVESNPEVFESGGYSARVYLTAGATDDAQINLWIAPGTNSKLGVETAFSFNGTPFYIYCLIEFWQASVLHTAGLKWDVYNNKLYYYSSGAAWTEITGVTVPTPVASAFNHLKCVIDFGNHLYMRGIANGLEVGLSDKAIYTVATTPGDIIRACIKVGHVLNQIVTVWVDNIAVTYSEPA